MNILFVCTGNTCRSPMAQALFSSIADEKGLQVTVKSAGIFASDAGKASPQAVEALFEKSIPLNHSSSKLTEELLHEADYVFTMTIQHKQLIVEQYAHVKDKVFTLKEFATGSEGDVSDPFGGSLSIYQETRDELETLLYQLAKKLKQDHKSS
ncbi:low molecular weight protein arginine phosphatase [Bacillus altitudinis MN12]|jgi:protein-tyrosine-phosphatase|uniref:Low molecular weight protein arginine phosphatase n=3 Tax=Bacillus TaxID=1386 RepID=A0A1K1UWM5_BACAB|nr:MULTISPECIES: low molecular weight protein arginine phosphatase [Bacillus]AHL73139.1 protein tyrosine phosphatase [Bacillus pumilus]KML19888.1 protein tyrosine phosphatase [Bacillus stratosphericus]MBW3698795.1 low molecular weight protein arginine phosphatase [Bacillus aerophilus]MDH8709212.1 protein-tyrosine-phosphatase [Micromonospora sp. 1209]CVN06429.1 low molecular weight phosphotyrosine protein phosphatase [Streptococcus pneumoniae]